MIRRAVRQPDDSITITRPQAQEEEREPSRGQRMYEASLRQVEQQEENRRLALEERAREEERENKRRWKPQQDERGWNQWVETWDEEQEMKDEHADAALPRTNFVSPITSLHDSSLVIDHDLFSRTDGQPVPSHPGVSKSESMDDYLDALKQEHWDELKEMLEMQEQWKEEVEEAKRRWTKVKLLDQLEKEEKEELLGQIKLYPQDDAVKKLELLEFEKLELLEHEEQERRENARLVVHKLVNNHIHNLPIYLLYLPDMRLVHRTDVKALIWPAIDGLVDEYLTAPGDPTQKEEHLKQMVKDKTAYAICSHRWLAEGELTFQDLSKLESISVAGLSLLINRPKELKMLRGAGILDQALVSTAKGNTERNRVEVFMRMKEICDCLSDQDHCAADFVKLVRFCEAALRCQCNYVWLDAGCINRRSSAELEESIRSMFSWYRNSNICIVHLSQTTVPLMTMAGDAWFQRGWTLQELLAPKVIKFFSQSWCPLTAKRNDKIPDDELGIPLWEFISEITRIPEVELLHFEPGTINVRERMLWASQRETTRIEDMAYCLIGIFNIPLSIAYGEGPMAFYRLQVEIVQRSHDRGLFAWNGSPSSQNSMFAAGPEGFFPLESPLTVAEEVAGSADPTYALTNYGLRIPLSIYDVRIEPLSEHGGAWTYELKVPGFKREIEVAFEFDPNAQYSIGILGNIGGDTFLAIVLISLEIGSRRYKRVTTIEVIRPPRVVWKAPEVIFIE